MQYRLSSRRFRMQSTTGRLESSWNISRLVLTCITVCFYVDRWGNSVLLKKKNNMYMWTWTNNWSERVPPKCGFALQLLKNQFSLLSLPTAWHFYHCSLSELLSFMTENSRGSGRLVDLDSLSPCHVRAECQEVPEELGVWMQTELGATVSDFLCLWIKLPKWEGDSVLKLLFHTLEDQWASVARLVNTNPMQWMAVLTTQTLFHQRYNIASEPQESCGKCSIASDRNHLWKYLRGQREY